MHSKNRIVPFRNNHNLQERLIHWVLMVLSLSNNKMNQYSQTTSILDLVNTYRYNSKLITLKSLRLYYDQYNFNLLIF